MGDRPSRPSRKVSKPNAPKRASVPQADSPSVSELQQSVSPGIIDRLTELAGRAGTIFQRKPVAPIAEPTSRVEVLADLSALRMAIVEGKLIPEGLDTKITGDPGFRAAEVLETVVGAFDMRRNLIGGSSANFEIPGPSMRGKERA